MTSPGQPLQLPETVAARELGPWNMAFQDHGLPYARQHVLVPIQIS